MSVFWWLARLTADNALSNFKNQQGQSYVLVCDTVRLLVIKCREAQVVKQY